MSNSDSDISYENDIKERKAIKCFTKKNQQQQQSSQRDLAKPTAKSRRCDIPNLFNSWENSNIDSSNDGIDLPFISSFDGKKHGKFQKHVSIELEMIPQNLGIHESEAKSVELFSVSSSLVEENHYSDNNEDSILNQKPSFDTGRGSKFITEKLNDYPQSDDGSSSSSLSGIRQALTHQTASRRYGTDFDDNDSSDSDDYVIRSSRVIKKNANMPPPTKRNRSSKDIISHPKTTKMKNVPNGVQSIPKSGNATEKLIVKQSKQKEKVAAKEQRIIERQEKQGALMETKVMNKRKKEESDQVNGKLYKKEVAVLMERKLYHDPSYQTSLVQKINESGYKVQEHVSALGCNAIQWIRQDCMKGGANSAIQAFHDGIVQEYEQIHTVGIIIDDPIHFIDLLNRSEHEEDDDYPSLEEWILGIEYGWRASWKSNFEMNNYVPAATAKICCQQRPRIIIFLLKIIPTLNKMWINYRKRQSKNATTSNSNNNQSLPPPPPPTAEEVHDAITWMLIQFQVECVHCASKDDISLHVVKMTRLLAQTPYMKDITELECIKKLKSQCTDNDDDITRSQDCWIRQLQQIPRISYRMAMNVATYYPTAMSLYNEYQKDNISIDEKNNLLSYCFHENQVQTKLSNWVYRIMTSNDPNEILY